MNRNDISEYVKYTLGKKAQEVFESLANSKSDLTIQLIRSGAKAVLESYIIETQNVSAVTQNYKFLNDMSVKEFMIIAEADMQKKESKFLFKVKKFIFERTIADFVLSSLGMDAQGLRLIKRTDKKSYSEIGDAMVLGGLFHLVEDL